MIRKAELSDIPQMVNLADRERTQRAIREPEFFRKASNGSDAQAKWLQVQLPDSRTIALCSEAAGKLTGFVIAVLTPAPPVYDPGGLTALIHDFVVDDPEQWTTVGIELIDEVSAQVKAKGAVQMVVVCTLADETKRAFLAKLGTRVVSEWHFRRF
jgi:GNAT superfamily N-acetyltransferase